LAGSRWVSILCARSRSAISTESRDVVVALDQGGARTDAVDQAAVQRPDRLGDWRAVGVDQQGRAAFIRAMAGQVDLADHLGGQGVQIGLGRVAQVAGADEHVVDVDQQAAAGAAGQFDQEVVSSWSWPVSGRYSDGFSTRIVRPSAS
jgi:hypothetical protein